jgi:hypothetical protein
MYELAQKGEIGRYIYASEYMASKGLVWHIWRLEALALCSSAHTYIALEYNTFDIYFKPVNFDDQTATFDNQLLCYPVLRRCQTGKIGFSSWRESYWTWAS